MASLSVRRQPVSRVEGAARIIAETRGWTWFFTCVLFLCFTFPLAPFRAVQAAGSMLMACLLLIMGIGWHLRAETRKTVKPIES
jgi:hypothetical protein